MSVKYVPVQWNRNKYFYDAVLIAMAVVYIFVFMRFAGNYQDVTRAPDGAIIRMRAFGTCAFFMLTIILCIGPLARLDRRFLPILYNRRHFGVLTCTIAAVHANYVLGWYFNFSDMDPYAALIGSNTDFGQWLGFPFEALGIFALFILLILAVTSHDFWLNFLTPPVWKTMHMFIYLAYASIVAHVALGYLQTQSDPTFAALTMACVVTVCGLHFAAGRLERGRDIAPAETADDGWVFAGEIETIANNRGKVVVLTGGERVAVFRYSGKLSALTNACAHQNGPLGEGRIKWGKVTCPWHGFQYNPEDGCAPAPFTERIATYRLRLDGSRIYVEPKAQPPGTRVEPVLIEGDAA